MASLAELARHHTRLDAPRDRPPPAPRRVVGPARRPLLRRPLLFGGAEHDDEGTRFSGKPRTARSWCSARSGRPPARPSTAATGSAASSPADERPLVARVPRARRDHRGRGHRRRAATSRCGCCASPSRHEGRTVGVLTRESAPLGRAPARRARAHLRRGVQPLRPHDRRGRVPVRRRDGPERGGAPGRRRRHPARRARCGSPTPRRTRVSALHRIGVHANTEGMRLGELGLPETGRAHRLRPGPARHRGDRAGPRDHRAHAVHPAARAAARSPARWCCCATSPSCAAATACCCRRTPPSGRSTTG